MTMSLQGLAFAEADISTQIVLMLAWAITWYLSLDMVAKRYIEPFVRSRPWKDQWLEHCRKMFKEGFFIEFKTMDEVMDLACLMAACTFAHLVGAALCLPSVLGCRGPVAAALACHGALCEAGFDLQDFLERMHAVTFGGKKGRDRNPTPILILATCHHSLSLSMVLPMNMLYASNVYYHELVFLLQGAAFFALVAQYYGFTLDVATASGLRQMQGCTGLAFLLMLWTRVYRYCVIAVNLLFLLRADGNSTLAAIGGATLGTMGLFNLLIAADCIKKFKKFAGMRVTSDGKVVPKELFGFPRLMRSASSKSNSVKAC